MQIIILNNHKSITARTSVRETRQRKDIQRSSQVVNQPLNNENHSINRKEQKSVQTAYDTDVQKRQIQNATQNQQSDNLEIVINLLHVILSQKTV